MRLTFAGLCLLAVTMTAGCSGIQQGVQEGVQQGTAEGTLSVLGQVALEEASGAKLAGELDCTSESASSDGGTPIECSGQTQDGKKATITGTVTSADPEKGVVKGKLTLTFDGKNLGEKDCIGAC
ncbi:hypothetical protein HNP84_000497 [Thermocatellispora tengchongensis]|uniref:DUF4333 domain-containing protein n=1 Tax=Thermocatellispora tengchongensis TaxID=1073253 RepID=A0A840NVH4_9ACTN|nr:hypothetical protein [Thermocatellispora tengchongensis]MBB5130809.1 hypothetical protein [Thermocatellispora tengchongensis]